MSDWKERVIDAAARLLAEDDNIEIVRDCNMKRVGYACRICGHDWVQWKDENHDPNCPRKVLESLIREAKEESKP